MLGAWYRPLVGPAGRRTRSFGLGLESSNLEYRGPGGETGPPPSKLLPRVCRSSGTSMSPTSGLLSGGRERSWRGIDWGGELLRRGFVGLPLDIVFEFGSVLLLNADVGVEGCMQ